MNKEIQRIGFDPKEVDPDLPINWDAIDLACLTSWNINSIRQFMGLRANFTAIYPATIEVAYLDAKISDEEKEDPETWEEFKRIKRGFPPILVVRTESGKLEIVDGNHRVWFAEQRGLETIGAWVVDKLVQKELDRRNLTETKIIEPDDAIHDGYITLYHGTIWPIALKAKKGQLGPQELKELVSDVLVRVFKETPQAASEYFDKHSGNRKHDPSLLFLTTSKEGAEGYARSSTKYGGEIFHDILAGYLHDTHKLQYRDIVNQHLMTNEPAIVTMNVPLSMVLTHPNWNTPLKNRLRDILDPRKREKYKDIWSVIKDLRLEVFVKEKIAARFIQRIDRVAASNDKIDKLNNLS